MKNIELTEDHKSKLLEMCKELFPEYIIIQFQVKSKPESINLNFFHTKGVITIHWFEFCMTYLAKKILNNNYFRLTAFSNSVIFKNNNPINILYREFKRNNINV